MGIRIFGQQSGCRGEMMRSVGHSHPEWGYLAPAPGFVRAVRAVLVATAVGATAGAAVVVSLIEHPSADTANSSIATHALVTGAQAAMQPTVPAKSLAQIAAPASAPSQGQRSGDSTLSPPYADGGPAAGADAHETSTAAKQQGSGSVAALSEPPQAAETASTLARDDSAVGTDAAAQKGKRRQANVNEVRSKPSSRSRGLGSFLSRLFSARSGPSNY